MRIINAHDGFVESHIYTNASSVTFNIFKRQINRCSDANILIFRYSMNNVEQFLFLNDVITEVP